ncbi:MAG: DUF2200 domain-containing protein [Tannerella sp.]|jgi:hypothetical protein|nr:DUF2200 domain-containing protein [Tannerella sp.]
MDKSRIYTTGFSSVYPFYIQKAEKKGRTKEEVDAIICRLTGYSQPALQQQKVRNMPCYPKQIRLSCKQYARESTGSGRLMNDAGAFRKR